MEAILILETPEAEEDIERLNGTVNYLRKFLLRPSDQVMEPFRRLTQTGPVWYWGEVEDTAFSEIKQLVTQAPVLAHYQTTQTRKLSFSAMPVALALALSSCKNVGPLLMLVRP